MKTNRRVCKKSELANPLQTIHCGVGDRFYTGSRHNFLCLSFFYPVLIIHFKTFQYISKHFQEKSKREPYIFAAITIN